MQFRTDVGASGGSPDPFFHPGRTFEVELTGRVEPGRDRDSVIRAMAIAFRRPLSSMDALLGGAPRVVKRGLSEIEARKYARVIAEAGAGVSVREDGTGPELPVAPAARGSGTEPRDRIGPAQWPTAESIEDTVAASAAPDIGVDWAVLGGTDAPPPSAPVRPREPEPPGAVPPRLELGHSAHVTPPGVVASFATTAQVFPGGYLPPAERIRRGMTVDVESDAGVAIPSRKFSLGALLGFLFSASGRVSRAQYLTMRGLYLVIQLYIGKDMDLGWTQAQWIAFVATYYSGLTLTIKRFHDTSRSGWRMLFVLIPILGGLLVFYETWILRGDDRQNGYGPKPSW